MKCKGLPGHLWFVLCFLVVAFLFTWPAAFSSWRYKAGLDARIPIKTAHFGRPSRAPDITLNCGISLAN